MRFVIDVEGSAPSLTKGLEYRLWTVDRYRHYSCSQPVHKEYQNDMIPLFEMGRRQGTGNTILFIDTEKVEDAQHQHLKTLILSPSAAAFWLVIMN